MMNLRDNPVVQAWIKEYNRHRIKLPKSDAVKSDCVQCGWPHNKNLLCGAGSTFGQVRLSGEWYYIDSSNVDFMLHFVKNLPRGFHWKDEVFWELENDTVVVSRIEGYNGCPHIKQWRIPLIQWESIALSIQDSKMQHDDEGRAAQEPK